MPPLKSLTQNEIKSFQEDGFTKVGHKIFSDKDFQGLKETVDNILMAHGNKTDTTAVGFVHFRNPEILFWILSDNVLDICEDVYGPNIGLLGCTIFYKKANTPDKAYWHTDTARIVRDNLFENKNDLLNMTISLTETSTSNGCLRLLPGSHLKHFPHDWNAPINGLIQNPVSIREEILDLKSAKFMELNENEASIHNVNTVHGSEANLSNVDRITLSCRFFSASHRCNVDNFIKNNILPRPYLVRGNDVANSQLKGLFLK